MGSKTVLPVNIAPSTVETPHLVANPSGVDVEGYYPEYRSDYNRDWFPSEILVSIVLTIIITAVIIYVAPGEVAAQAAAAGGPGLDAGAANVLNQARIARFARQAGNLGGVNPAGDVILLNIRRLGQLNLGANGGCELNVIAALGEAATILRDLPVGAAAYAYGSEVQQRIPEFLARAIDAGQIRNLAMSLDVNAVNVTLHPWVPPEARAQLFIGMTPDQQTEFIQRLPHDQLEAFLGAVIPLISSLDPRSVIGLLENLFNTNQGNRFGEILRRMIVNNSSYVQMLFGTMVILEQGRSIAAFLHPTVNVEDGRGWVERLPEILILLSPETNVQVFRDLVNEGHGLRAAFILHRMVRSDLNRVITPNRAINLFTTWANQGQGGIIRALFYHMIDYSQRGLVWVIVIFLNLNPNLRIGIIRYLIGNGHSAVVERLFTSLIAQGQENLIMEVIRNNNDSHFLLGIVNILIPLAPSIRSPELSHFVQFLVVVMITPLWRMAWAWRLVGWLEHR